MHPERQVIGETLRRLRIERHLSRKDLAERATVRQSYISQVEHGDSSLSLKNLFRLAEGLGLHSAVSHGLRTLTAVAVTVSADVIGLYTALSFYSRSPACVSLFSVGTYQPHADADDAKLRQDNSEKHSGIVRGRCELHASYMLRWEQRRICSTRRP